MKKKLVCVANRWINRKGNIPLIDYYLSGTSDFTVVDVLFSGRAKVSLNKQIYGGKILELRDIIRSFKFKTNQKKLLKKGVKIKFNTYTAWMGDGLDFKSELRLLFLTLWDKLTFKKVNFNRFKNRAWDGGSLINRIRSFIGLQLFLIIFSETISYIIKGYDEIIFICGYDRLFISIIYVANALNIKTIEFQHGIIHNKHSPYSNSHIAQDLCPKFYMLWHEKYLAAFPKEISKNRFFISNFKHLGIDTRKTDDLSFENKITVLIAFDNIFKIPDSLYLLISNNLNVNFILRPHPKSNFNRLSEIKKIVQNNSNCTYSDKNEDIQDCIRISTIVLVDISSVSSLSEAMKTTCYFYNKGALDEGTINISKYVKYIDSENLNDLIQIHKGKFKNKYSC